MTTAELQALYDSLGTQQRLSKRLGMSTATLGPYLRAHGVRAHKRGGHHGRRKTERPSTYHDQHDGDRAIFAAPCERRHCPEQNRECVLHDLGECDRCRVEHSLEYYAGSGAASGWDTEIVGVGR